MKKTLIVAASPSLNNAKKFYERLQFKLIEIDGEYFVMDGNYVIKLNDSNAARNGLACYKDNWDDEVALLREITHVKRLESGFVLNDFSGVRIQLLEGEGLEITGTTDADSLLGRVAGVSLEGINIAHMNQVYKILGFKKTMGDENGSWLSVANEEGFTISMMGEGTCPHIFYNPSLTYFNGKDNLRIIQELRDAGFQFTEEITVFNKEGVVDNVILRDPAGLGFFVFSD